MVRVNLQDAKTHLSRFVERAERGEVIVVCRHNKPVVEIRAIPVNPVPPTRVEGLLRGQIQFDPAAFAPMTDEELADFERGPLFPGTR